MDELEHIMAEMLTLIHSIELDMQTEQENIKRCVTGPIVEAYLTGAKKCRNELTEIKNEINRLQSEWLFRM